MASAGGVTGAGGFGGASGTGTTRLAGADGGRRGLPRPLATALLLVHTLFVLTVLGGLGVVLTASAYDRLDGGLLALTAYGAAPGVLGWWLARRTWEGGPRVRAGLAGVQVWLILGAVANIADGSSKGFGQLLLPALILYFLTRRESRDWYRLADPERAVRTPFSLRRMIRWGRRDEGQTAVEYAGLVAVVAAIIAALLVSGLGGQILSGIQAEICRVTGTACPAPGTGPGGDVTAGDDTTNGGTGGDGSGGDGTGGDGSGDTEGGSAAGGSAGGEGGDQGGGDEGGGEGGRSGTGGSDAGTTGGGEGGGTGSGNTSGAPGGSTEGTSGGNTGAAPGGEAGEASDGEASGGAASDGDASDGGTPEGAPADPAAPPVDPADPVAARDEIDEPPYEEPAARSSGDGDGDDEGCFSGFGAFFGCAGDQLGQVGAGLFVDGIWGDLTGIWDVVTNPVETWNGLMDYGGSLGSDWWSDSAGARQKWDDGDYLGAILGWGGASLNTGGTVLYDAFIGDDVADQWNSGNHTRAVTTVLWNVGSVFIPGYGGAKVAEKVGALGKLSRLTDDAAEAAQDARRAAEAGDLDALEDAARRADEAADEAEDAARRTGCTIAAPLRPAPYGHEADGGPTTARPPDPGTDLGTAPGTDSVRLGGPDTGIGLLGGPGTGTTVLAAAPVAVTVADAPHIVLAQGGCDEEAKEEARRAREHARAAYLERKRAEEPGRAQEALADKKQWPAPRHGDTADPRNYNPPDWAADLSPRTYGDADGGDGFWASRDRNPAPTWRNESWLRYQEQVTGTERGYEYVVPHTDPDVPDVEFDGWDSSRQTFLEAKNGYDSFLTADRTELTPSGRERLLAEARRQTEAARGKGLEWHFSNEEVADAARDAFEDAGLDIEVVHTRPGPVAGERKPGAFD
ncbi:Tox-REase-5 domain-containing protein [Streptomyces sp. bgisy022]|uniref:Tox-REase-5 domain-containing protein n=1 Tax=Streptomyces sp. bgisy022 TaxID=3413769 RepID=UPI003D717A67